MGSATTNGTSGAGGTASGGTLNFTGGQGQFGGVAAATHNTFGDGGNTPLGFGIGGRTPLTVTTSLAGTGYGAGGSGAYNGATATAAAGAAGTNGVVIIEY